MMRAENDDLTSLSRLWLLLLSTALNVHCLSDQGYSPLSSSVSKDIIFCFLFDSDCVQCWLASRVSTIGDNLYTIQQMNHRHIQNTRFLDIAGARMKEMLGPAHKKPLNMALMRLHHIEKQWGMKLKISRKKYFINPAATALLLVIQQPKA